MPPGKKIKLYYDPRGNVIRTINPDKSEQWVVQGKPDTLSSVHVKNNWSFGGYIPTPWESYTYDANDLAPTTHGTSFEHDYTPKNSVVDPLGRTVKTIDRLDQSNSGELVMKYSYDIQGNSTQVTDTLNRIVFTHRYDLANRDLRPYHIDSANKQAIIDAIGRTIESSNDRGACTLSAFDAPGRPKFSWAKDKAVDTYTVRYAVVYGDEPQGPVSPTTTNHYGKPYKNYDEAGLNTALEYDFKGNITAYKKQVIKDSLLLNAINNGASNSWVVIPYTVDWTTTPWNEEVSLLEGSYQTDIIFDAHNRAIETLYPVDVYGIRKTASATYNRAGGLEKVTFDGVNYIEHIAYNAKGQNLLVVFGNGLMTRHTYDVETFCIKRTRTSSFLQTGWTFTDNAGVKEDKVLSYDLAGNIRTTTDKVTDCGLPATPDQLLKNFSYDALNRLLIATGRESNTQPSSDLWEDTFAPGTPNASNCRAYTEQFEYDKAGNILKIQHIAAGNSWTRRYNYNSGVNILQSIDDNQTVPNVIAGFSYDISGNQTQCNTERNYEWNFADRLKAFYNQTGSGIEPTVYALYLYDASGNRTKKLVRKSGGTWESVTYIDGTFEYHKHGAEEKNYTRIAGDVELRTGAYTGDISDDTIYQMKDHIGSVGLRINEYGTTIDREEYYPFGDTSLRTFVKKRYRYCGREKDNESGLYYYGARYYSAWVCRFISVDPLALKYAQLTPYNYSGNEPIGDFDIDGQQNNTTPGTPNAAPSDSLSSPSSGGVECDSICTDTIIQNTPADTIQSNTDTISAEPIKADTLPGSPAQVSPTPKEVTKEKKPAGKTDEGKAKTSASPEKKPAPKTQNKQEEKGWLATLKSVWNWIWGSDEPSKDKAPSSGQGESAKGVQGKSVEAPKGKSASGEKSKTSTQASEKSSSTGKYDIDKAVATLNKKALDNSSGKCALYVRWALEAGGLNTDGRPTTGYAKDYGPFLLKSGFTEVDQTNYAPKKGDVVVLQNYKGGNIAGHIAMYNGSQWISDFKQRDIWAGSGYRSAKPQYNIYRKAN